MKSEPLLTGSKQQSIRQKLLKRKRSVDKIVSAFAGFAILLSLTPAVRGSPIFHHQYWLWFTAFVGANLLQSASVCFHRLLSVGTDAEKNGCQAGAGVLIVTYKAIDRNKVQTSTP